MKYIKKLLLSRTVWGAAAVLIIWELICLIVDSNIIPSPVDTVIAFFGLLDDGILLHGAASLFRVFTALILSLIIGIPLGMLLGLSTRLDNFLSPVVYILYPVPKAAFLPVFMLLLGLGDKSKICLIVSIIVFQIILAVRDGIKEIPKELKLSVESMGLSPLQTYRHLVIPAILPKIITSIRISIGIGMSVLFFAENFATTYGIGYFIMNNWVMVNYVDMFAGILALSIMGVLLLKLIDWIEKVISPWSDTL